MKVWPKDDNIRKVIKHPAAGAFPVGGGPGDWPDDAYTARRIADGDVHTNEPSSEKPRSMKEAKGD